MELSRDQERFLLELEEECDRQNAKMLNEMAVAIVSGLRQAEEHGDFVDLVGKMLEIDESIVSKLEFVISTSFIEQNIHKIEGGRYAN